MSFSTIGVHLIHLLERRIAARVAFPLPFAHALHMLPWELPVVVGVGVVLVLVLAVRGEQERERLGIQGWLLRLRPCGAGAALVRCELGTYGQ